MEQNKLTNIVEAILFVAGDAVALSDIAEKLDVKLQDVKKAIETLKEKHKQDGINLITFKDKAQLTSNPEYSEQIESVLNPIKEKALTKAALETVAIIAYQQPITRLEVEQVRGVSCDYAIQVLLNHNLIEVVGRKDAVGKPLLFGTTEQFLKKFEIESLDDLPKYEELLNQIKIIKTETGLYKEYEALSPDEAEKLEAEKLEKDSNEQELEEEKSSTNKENKQNKPIFIADDIEVKQVITKGDKAQEFAKKYEEVQEDEFDENDFEDDNDEDDESSSTENDIDKKDEFDDVDDVFKQPFEEAEESEKEEYEKFLES